MNNTFLETFKYKQFARNFVKYNGDVPKAYEVTFGGNSASVKKLFQKANAILERPEVQFEIKELLPTDEELTDVIKKAIGTPTEPLITWSDKHKYVKTSLEMKGYIGTDVKPSVTNNVVMFVKE